MMQGLRTHPGIPGKGGTHRACEGLGSRLRGNGWEETPTLQLGGAAAVVASILGGAHIVRVHNVAGVLPAVRIADAVLAACR